MDAIEAFLPEVRCNAPDVVEVRVPRAWAATWRAKLVEMPDPIFNCVAAGCGDNAVACEVSDLPQLLGNFRFGLAVAVLPNRLTAWFVPNCDVAATLAVLLLKD